MKTDKNRNHVEMDGISMRWIERTESLTGVEAVRRLGQFRLILFGTGGVGGWCAEALARMGVQHLTLVDFDTVQESNINRQIAATVDSIGKFKVQVLKERLLTINPRMDIRTSTERFEASTVGLFDLSGYDYILDAIDSVDDKILLAEVATRCSGVVFYSSMGAGRKYDATRVQTSPFSQVHTCPLARVMRQRMRKKDVRPHYDFRCVFSDEMPQPRAGTVVHVVAVFGFVLAQLVFENVLSSSVK